MARKKPAPTPSVNSRLRMLPHRLQDGKELLLNRSSSIRILLSADFSTKRLKRRYQRQRQRVGLEPAGNGRVEDELARLLGDRVWADHGHATAAASAIIDATITRKNTASKSNIMCHMARPLGFIQRR